MMMKKKMMMKEDSEESSNRLGGRPTTGGCSLSLSLFFNQAQSLHSMSVALLEIFLPFCCSQVAVPASVCVSECVCVCLRLGTAAIKTKRLFPWPRRQPTRHPKRCDAIPTHTHGRHVGLSLSLSFSFTLSLSLSLYFVVGRSFRLPHAAPVSTAKGRRRR